MQDAKSFFQATNAANHIFWLEQLQPTIRENAENRDIGPDNFDSLDLEKIHFSYPTRPHARVLRGIDLHVSQPLPPLPFKSSHKACQLISSVDQKRPIHSFRRRIRLRKGHHDRPSRAFLRPHIRPPHDQRQKLRLNEPTTIPKPSSPRTARAHALPQHHP